MQESLFDRLGGAEHVFEIVSAMYKRVQADEELSPFFARATWERLQRMQFEFMAAALGGPVTYSGAEIQAIHAGRGIKQQHFSKFVGHLADEMEDRGVPRDDIDAVLAQLAMYRDRITGGANVDG